MASRLGLGPVFASDWLTTSRKWQMYALRAGFVGVLLIGLTCVWWSSVSPRSMATIAAQAAVGEAFYNTIVGIELALVLLAAPAATAGAVCLDKARGTLAHLLVTDLSDAEIVLGKLASRLVPVVGLVLCGLPVLALGTLLGGIDPNALLSAFLVILACALLGCTVAFALSVWATRTHEVLLATYAVGLLWLLALPIWRGINDVWLTGPLLGPPPEILRSTNPIWQIFTPSIRGGRVELARPARYLLVASLISAALAALAVAKVRSVAVRQADRPIRVRRSWISLGWTRRWLPGPSLDGNPVLWREWHRRQPSRWLRAVWLLYGAVATAFSLLAIASTWRRPGIVRGELLAIINALQVGCGLLLLSISSVTALAEERVRGSLDVLLATPLSTRSIVWGKWWGAFLPALWLTILPGLLGARVAWLGGSWLIAAMLVALILAYGAALTSLGLVLATWIPRLSRALALAVGAYVLVSIGWLFLVALFLSGNNSAGPGVVMGSPIYGAGLMTIAINEASGPLDWADALAWGTIWIVGYAAAAAGLLVATIETFNRCLGRLPDSSERFRLTR